MERPTTTLFLLTSVDGKISTGACDELDIDRDLPLIPGVREGLHQYYEIEQTTDLWSLNSGRVMAKIGANVREMPEKSPVSFVIIDNSHLTEHGVRFMCAWAKNFVLVTTNPSHPAFSVNIENLHVIKQDTLSLSAMLEELYAEFGLRPHHPSKRWHAQFPILARRADRFCGHRYGSPPHWWKRYLHTCRWQVRRYGTAFKIFTI